MYVCMYVCKHPLYHHLYHNLLTVKLNDATTSAANISEQEEKVTAQGEGDVDILFAFRLLALSSAVNCL